MSWPEAFLRGLELVLAFLVVALLIDAFRPRRGHGYHGSGKLPPDWKPPEEGSGSFRGPTYTDDRGGH